MKMTESIISKHMEPINGSAIRDIFKLLGVPGMISFAGGNPSNSALEPDVVGGIAQDVLKKYGPMLLQYGGTEGFMPLRESTAEFLKGCGVETTAEEILPTGGSTQAIDLLLNAVTDPGDTVLVESPTFLGTLQAMAIRGLKTVAIPTDENGVIPEAAEELIKKHSPKMMYIIPTFQNPTGVTLNLERRKQLAALAEKYGVILAEDDPYRDLRYDGEAMPAIKHYDTEGWVVYLSSYSKLISPGMRVGCATVRNALLRRKMVVSKQAADVHTPLLNQAIVDEYLRRGLMAPHIERICRGYKEQLSTMLEGFEAFPEGTTHTVPQGGLFVWCTLPERYDAFALLKKVTEQGVAYVPGTHFYPEGGHLNTMRLNFSNSEVPQIREGMHRLADMLKTV